MKITQKPKMYQCSLCGRADRKTYRGAREGKLLVICQQCVRK